MAFDGMGEGLKRILGILIVTAAMTGCGGSSGTSSATSSTNSSSVSTASAIGTIALSSSTYQANASSSAIITVNRTGSPTGAATASYSTIDGSAVAGADYTVSSGQLSWSDGDNSAKTVIVPVSATGAGKQFSIALTAITGGDKFGNPDAATIVVASTSGSGGMSGGTSGAQTATVSWAAPNENTNGTALTNLVGYNIYYGSSSNALTNKININSVGIMTYVIDNLSSGDWYFALTAVNSSGVESVLSATVEATL